ncbi:MAG: hypothetical protein JRH07_18235, partial [Deltaproteobacteria bacterium]|nr:hypothetical protein [Deltaproteobacteria bacterium]
MPYKEGRRWRATVMVGGRRRTRAFRTKAEAKDWEGKQRKEMREAVTTPMIGFHDLYLEYLNEIRLRHDRKTYLEKKALGRRAFEAWGYVDVMEVNPSMVQRLLADRAEKVSKNAFNKDRKNFLAFFNWIKKMKGIDHNPVLSVERLAVERRPQPVPSEEDVVRLLV